MTPRSPGYVRSDFVLTGGGSPVFYLPARGEVVGAGAVPKDSVPRANRTLEEHIGQLGHAIAFMEIFALGSPSGNVLPVLWGENVHAFFSNM